MFNQRHSDVNDSNNLSWLEPLRRQSWEMELLVTGFVLIGLLQLPDYLKHIQEILSMNMEGNSILKSYVIYVPISVLMVGIRIMTMNLILLLLLRGFWIGLIGLTSAFPNGINHENLSFSERFATYLRQKSVDTESIIVRLDNICSSVFALSFLTFFIIISLGLYLTQLQIFTSLFNMAITRNAAGNILYFLLALISGLIMLFYLLGGILKMIDFVSVGILKKINKKWFARPYFLISRFISIVTLAFIYRPIYYILSSNFPKNVIRLVLFIYLIIAGSIFFNFKFSSDHHYYPQFFRNTYEVSYNEYENLRPDDAGVLQNATIQSDVINDNYIKLFIPYNVTDNQKLKSLCPDLKSLRTEFSSYIPFLKPSIDINKSNVKAALKCFSEFYRISVDDSVYSHLNFFFYRHPNNDEPGIITHIPVHHLEPGYHSLKILEKENENPNIIQFWKE